MTPLMTALLGTAALLVGLCLRILRHHELLERHRQERARLLALQRIRVVDLDGQVCWLLPEELRAFLRSCWAELELAEGSTWAVVRRHWRRSSLRWHPATAAIRSCGCESNRGL